MIPKDKEQNAFYALNHILIWARKMAYDGVSHREIAEVLDVAEYLPRLFADHEDQTQAFRKCLVNLTEKWPHFKVALERFDDPNLGQPW
jgi:hypothetical protein